MIGARAAPVPATSRRAAAVVVAVALPATLAILVASVAVGTLDVPLATAWDAFVAFDPASSAHHAVRDLRLPRAVAATLVGACLAAAGAVMQGTTRNDLASPSLLGVNAGAALALAVAFAVAPATPLHGLVLVSTAGAAGGALLVHLATCSVPGGATPVRLVLAGAAVSAFLAAVASAVVIRFEVAEDVLFFAAGGLSGTRWPDVATLAPWAVAGLVAAVALAPSIAVLHLGDEAAEGLGLRTRTVRRAAAVAVVVLAGAAVSIAGPVAFVGLVVPHLARLLVGADDRVVVPVSAVLGAALLAVADLGARLLHPTREVPLGMVTALVGVPFLLRLVSRRDR